MKEVHLINISLKLKLKIDSCTNLQLASGPHRSSRRKTKIVDLQFGGMDISEECHRQ